MQGTLTPIPKRLETISAHKERGGSIAMVLPIYYPRALFRAFNILPVEVWGPPQVDSSYGAAHLQSYVCSIVQNALSFILTADLENIDFIVVPHACDSLQGLASILTDFVRPRQPVLPIYLPRGRRESDVCFLTQEFHSLYQRLEKITGQSPRESDLMECIKREETTDGILAALHWQRKYLPLTQLELYRLIRSREYLPAEVFSDLAHEVLAKAADMSQGKGIPILLSGIVPEPMSMFETIAELGGVVVADDMACCGRRLYPPGRAENVFRRMAESILGAPPCPTRGSPIQNRLEHLVQLAKTSGAEGVLFYGIKFCEPELFDIPSLTDGLEEAGIPSLVVETDLSESFSHQVAMRLEIFLEMIAWV